MVYSTSVPASPAEIAIAFASEIEICSYLPARESSTGGSSLGGTSLGLSIGGSFIPSSMEGSSIGGYSEG